MKKIYLFILFCILGLGSSPAQISPQIDNRLQITLDSICDVYNIKGATAAVLLPNAGTWKGAYGLADNNGQPVTTDMLMGIGSNTKTYISTLLLKMQEDNLINLNDTIGTWLQNEPNINGQITIRQLLSHTSGLYNYTSHPSFNAAINNDNTAIWQPEDIFQFVSAPYFNPGTNYNYSNTNYLVAGIIIKQVLGQPLSTSLRNYILQPQSLNNTFLYPDEALTAPMANIWTIYYLQPYLEDIISLYGYNHNAMFSLANAAGAIVSTAEDNVTFFDRLMSEEIIDAGSLQQMKTFRNISSTRAYGLGLFRTKNFNGRVVYGHGGTNIGYINENIFDSISGACISVLTNQDSVSNSIILNKLVLSLHKVILQNPLGIKDVNTLSAQVYPNPVSDLLTIKLEGSNEVSIKLVDLFGRVKYKDHTRNNSHLIDLSQIDAGVYSLEITDMQNKKSSVQKVIVL